jgi:hypothetical protein
LRRARHLRLAQMKKDDDLVPLHGRQGFTKLLEEVERR